MRRILVIGIGSIGGKVVESFLHKSRNDEDKIVDLCIDTDLAALNELEGTTNIPFVDAESLGNVVLKLNEKKISPYYSFLNKTDKPSVVDILSMNKSANGWREKALLAFENFLYDEDNKESFFAAIDKVMQDYDGAEGVEIYTATSIFGGTGSGLFLPIIFYVKKYLTEKYSAKINSQAVLVCPRVFDDFLTGEQKTKAYANAYSSLRELNAINAVTDDSSEEIKNSCHFVLGGKEDEYIGLLFDSDDAKYRTKEYRPFDKIYLFDKIPGITSVNEHLKLLNNLFYNVYCGVSASERQEKASVYNALSATEIKYPVDSLTEFLANKVVYDSIDGECLNIRRRISKRIISGFGKTIINNFDGGITDVFANNFMLEIDDNKFDIKENDYVLGRSVSNDLKFFDVYQLTNDVVLDCLGVIKNTLLSGVIVNIDDIIERNKYFKIKANNGLTLSRIKGKRREKIQNKIISIYDYIKSLKSEAIKKYFQVEESLCEIPFNGDVEKNPILNLIKDEFGFLHPSIALTRLTIFKTLVEWNFVNGKKRIDKRAEDFYEEYSKYVKSDLMDVDGKTSLYFEYNLSELLEASGYNLDFKNKNDKEIIKIKRTHQKKNAYILDNLLYKKNEMRLYFKSLYAKVIDDLTKRALIKVIDGVDSLIASYLRILDGLEYNLNFEKRELIASENACNKNNSIEYNVGSDEENRERLYKKYIKLIDGDKLRIRDGKFGESVFLEISKTQADNGLQSVGNKGVEIVEKAILDVIEEIKDSSLFEDITSRCTFEYMAYDKYGLIDANKFYSNLKMMLNGCNTPLVLDKALTYKHDGGICKDSKILISRKNHEFLLNNAKTLGLNASHPNDILKELVVNLGCYDRSFDVSDNLSSGIIYIVNEYTNFKLSSVFGISEVGETPIYYDYYKKALKNCKEHNTPMWSVGIFGGRVADCELNYISELKQKEYLQKYGKAVLYAFMHGNLTVCKNDEDEEGCFYFSDEDSFTQIKYGGKHVLQSESYKIVKYLKSKENSVERFSVAFDKMVEDACLELPSITADTVSVNNLVESIKKSKLIKALLNGVYSKRLKLDLGGKLGLIDFINDIIVAKDKESVDNAEYVVRAGFETIKKLCEFRTLPNNEDAYKVVTKQIFNLFAVTGNKKEDCKKLVKKYF